MKNILLLTDFSDLSDFARDLADKIGKGIDAKIHVLKIVDIPNQVTLSPEGELIGGMGTDLTDFKKEKEESIEKMKEWTADMESAVHTEVKYGALLYTIKDYARNNDIELVVMGMHSIEGLSEKLYGSVTQQVILQNKLPVLSLKCDRSQIDFSDFLIAGDFENYSPMNFELFKALQKVFNSKIHLLCVNTSKQFKTTALALDRMKKFAEVNGLENVEYHMHSDQSTEAGIVNFANNYDANHDLDIDIVAVEKKNKSALNYWFTGCEAIDVVNHVYRPIVTYLEA